MADAGNIYAYDPNGCCMGLLKILKSEDIGQDVCYAVPDYNDREVNYILYTDKCGCSCCLPLEDEIIIHTTPGTIKTFNVGISGSNVNTKRTEAFGSNWCKTVVRYRTDNTYPTSITDGTLLVEETTLNQYNSGYNKAVSSFSGSCVHAKAFAVDNDGNILSQACGASILWTDKSFGCTGSMQSFTMPPGTYCLQVWGANATGGRCGGYSSGCIVLTSSVSAYAVVGGCGPNSTAGGYNGGGAGVSNGRGGGGGTDIRIGGNTLYHRVIVAGGSGGQGPASNGGSGGGCYGGRGCDNADNACTGANRDGGGALQTGGGISWNSCGSTRGTFGQGGPATGYSSGGGGGGWYGGGGAYDNDSDSDGRGGGGGSGYVWTAATCSSHPCPSCLSTSYYLCNAVSCKGNTSFPAPGGGNETGHAGHGCAKITKIA